MAEPGPLPGQPGGDHANGLQSPPASGARDVDESEWEYEYSTTETETYYLTVDLSIPDFATRKENRIVHNCRSGYRTWYNPLTEKPDMKGVFDDEEEDKATPRRQLPGDDEEEEEEDDDDDDDDDLDDADEDDGGQNGAAGGRNGDKEDDLDDVDEDDEGRSGAADGRNGNKGPRRRRPRDSSGNNGIDRGDGKGSGLDTMPGSGKSNQIQILDLHSERPLIAHRGLVFTGSWATNIGTELLFTRALGEDGEKDGVSGDGGGEGNAEDGDSEEERPGSSSSKRHRTGQNASSTEQLPRLADLRGVTLLAASTARLQCTPSTLRSRTAPQERHEAWVAARAANGVGISIMGDITDERRPQARFLERLMAVKRARGETDQVTSATIDNPDNAVQDDSEEDLDRDRKRRKKIDGEVRRRRKKAGPAALGPGRGGRGKRLSARGRKAELKRGGGGGMELGSRGTLADWSAAVGDDQNATVEPAGSAFQINGTFTPPPG